MTQYPKLRAVRVFHDRHSAIVIGDEPGHYRPYAHIPACGSMAVTNAIADLFAAAPQLLEVLERADIVWGDDFAGDNPINGGDLVQWFAAWLPNVRTVIAEARGRETEAAGEAAGVRSQ
jgi:hypothetical protein